MECYQPAVSRLTYRRQCLYRLVEHCRSLLVRPVTATSKVKRQIKESKQTFTIQEQNRRDAECARLGRKDPRRACNSTRHGVLTVTGVDEDVACVVAGKGGGGGGAELLTVGVVGCADEGPGAVPDGFPFWM
jgi:hypothetical protein